MFTNLTGDEIFPAGKMQAQNQGNHSPTPKLG